MSRAKITVKVVVLSLSLIFFGVLGWGGFNYNTRVASHLFTGGLAGIGKLLALVGRYSVWYWV